MSKLKILITGASGLLGSHCIKLLRHKYEIHALVREIPKTIYPEVSYHVCDMKCSWSTESLPEGISYIYHLIQSDLFREFPDYALDVFNVNVTSTVKLLDYARKTGVRKFIFTSTGGIYDRSMEAVSENSPISTLGSLGNYFATKLCSEILTHNYTKYFDVTILRLFFMYGAGQKKSMLIPRLIENIRSGNPISLAKNGGIKINPIHVSDVVKILEKLLSQSGSYTFNVAGPQVMSLKEICDIIGEKMGIVPVYEYSGQEPEHTIANIDLIGQKIYRPKVHFKNIISELL